MPEECVNMHSSPKITNNRDVVLRCTATNGQEVGTVAQRHCHCELEKGARSTHSGRRGCGVEKVCCHFGVESHCGVRLSEWHGEWNRPYDDNCYS
jgi:hypothetical protein